jgi:DNA polymerase III alpha subunit (gram-positive type)
MNLFAKGRQIVLQAPQLYLDVDIETDGWAGHGSMLSLGAVAPEGQTFYSEIKPLFEEYVPRQREFCETHGLERTRLLQDAPAYDEVMSRFSDWVGELSLSSGKLPVFTAFNAGFDFGFVQLYYLKAGLPNPFAAAPFDLKSLAMAVNPAWDWALTAKSQLPPQILPDGDFTHHALEDAIYQQKLHFGLAGLLGDKDEVPS